MEKLQIKMMPIEALKPYENNAKLHPDNQVDQIVESIKEFGFNDPISIWKDGIIIEGHGRLLAAQKLGLMEVPVIDLSHLTDQQRKAYTLVHNQTTMNSGFDIDKLNFELQQIDFDMSIFDFNLPTELSIESIEEDIVPDIDEENEPTTKLGDIYQLGKHRLMCGDSTKESDVSKLMDGELADLVVTDPPYNVAIVGGSHALSPEERIKRGGKTILNDKMCSKDFLEFLTKAFSTMEKSLKLGGAFYIWYASAEHINFETALNNNKLLVKEQLIWNKSSFTFGRADYHWKHEPCLYGWKEGAGHYFTDDRTQSTVFEDALPEFNKMKKEELVNLLKEVYSDKISTTIINEDKPLKSDLHPTMKPVKLIGRLIKNSSKQGEKVLDLFGGSGTTLIACEQLNRKCYMMEYDPKYATVIINRWEQLTGQKAKKIN